MTARDDFYTFVYERQAIWHRRFVQQLPSPWTSDPILARYRFTNVHRELDRGTQTLIVDVVNNSTLGIEQKIRRTLLYRIFNNVDTWAECLRDAQSYEDAFTRVRARKTRGEPVMTRAYVASVSPSLPGRDGIERLFLAAKGWNITRVHEVCQRATSLRQVFTHVTSMPAWGPMNGWQLALDLSYLYLHLHDDEWVAAYSEAGTSTKKLKGSGAGAALIDPYKTAEGVIQELRDEQDKAFMLAGLDWSIVRWEHKPRLTLADVEHCLCEFVKYSTVKRGERTHMRTFQ